MTSGLDPQGRRALFETPVDANRREVLAPGRSPEGRNALFSAGPPRPGTALVECGGCGVRSRASLADIGIRFVTGSLWMPGRQRGHWMRCPACGSRQWCRIGWGE